MILEKTMLRGLALALAPALLLGAEACRQQSDKGPSPDQSVQITSATSTPTSPAPPAEVARASPRAKFKVTGAKPSDVEAALRQGWTLVNCSVSAVGLGSNEHFVEHCYFTGDDHVWADGGP